MFKKFFQTALFISILSSYETMQATASSEIWDVERCDNYITSSTMVTSRPQWEQHLVEISASGLSDPDFITNHLWEVFAIRVMNCKKPRGREVGACPLCEVLEKSVRELVNNELYRRQEKKKISQAPNTNIEIQSMKEANYRWRQFALWVTDMPQSKVDECLNCQEAQKSVKELMSAEMHRPKEIAEMIQRLNDNRLQATYDSLLATFTNIIAGGLGVCVYIQNPDHNGYFIGACTAFIVTKFCLDSGINRLRRGRWKSIQQWVMGEEDLRIRQFA